MFPLFSLLLSCSLVREAKGSLELSSLTHVQYRVPEWPIADLSTITQEWILTLILCRVAQIPFFFIGEYKYRYIRSSTRRVPILCDAICIHTKWMGANCTALYFEEECGTIPFQILFRFSTTPMWNQACHSDFEPSSHRNGKAPLHDWFHQLWLSSDCGHMQLLLPIPWLFFTPVSSGSSHPLDPHLILYPVPCCTRFLTAGDRQSRFTDLGIWNPTAFSTFLTVQARPLLIGQRRPYDDAAQLESL